MDSFKLLVDYLKPSEPFECYGLVLVRGAELIVHLELEFESLLKILLGSLNVIEQEN